MEVNISLNKGTMFCNNNPIVIRLLIELMNAFSKMVLIDEGKLIIEYDSWDKRNQDFAFEINDSLSKESLVVWKQVLIERLFRLVE